METGRQLLAAGLILAGMSARSLAAQADAVPTFGTTVVVPGGLTGVIYSISPLSKFLPYFPALDPLGVIYTSTLNIAPRNFRQGFPGVTGRYEWFAIDYSGRFWIENPGQYRFELTSDDGSRLYVDDQQVVNNDGLHSPETRNGAVDLRGGIHRIRVSYFQGPRETVALVLRVAGPGEEWRVFNTEEFKPPPDPATWMYQRQVFSLSPIKGAPGDDVSLEISLDWAAAPAPAALKWDLLFPAQLLDPEGGRPEIGGAAMGSGKSLQCVARRQYSYACILDGGQNPIANGPVAILHFKIRSTAGAATTAVRIQNPEATLGSKKLTLNDAEGAVVIRRR